MLSRRLSSAVVCATGLRRSVGIVAGTAAVAAPVVAQVRQTLGRRPRAFGSKAATAATHLKTDKSTATANTVAPQSPTVAYVTGAQLTRATDAQTALHSVSFFLTQEQLASLRAAAAADTPHHGAITIESLLGAKCALFDGAAPFAPASLQDFKADAGETLWLYPTPEKTTGAAAKAVYPRLLLVGLGAANEVTLGSYRSASWKAVASFQSLLLTRVGLLLPPPPLDEQQRFFDSHFHNELVASISRIALLSDHYFRKYLSDKQIEAKKKKPLERIDIIELQPPVSTTSTTVSTRSKKSANASALPHDHAAIVAQQAIIAAATIRAREWSNERGDVAHPAFMEAEARTIAKDGKMKITVLHEADLEKEGYNLLRAVGKAGTHKARLVVLEYRGDPSSSEVTALVGKGITFDTGGLLIKGRGSMENMHLDKSGATTVLATMSALPALGLKMNIVGAIALAENAISHEAYKPLAIIPTAKGSVEIADTDAEGRLALADALMYVQKHYTPSKVIDLATLTGAAVVALGEHIAALFSNSDSLAHALQEASNKSGERVWRMPILKEHADELKATYSDMQNKGSRMGGACIAAAFLEKFIEKNTAWVHLDIAGPAMLSKAKEWQPEGGTGFGAQLLLEYFLQQQEANAHAPIAAGLTSEQVKAALSKLESQE